MNTQETWVDQNIDVMPIVPVTLTVADEYNNEATCIANVTVQAPLSEFSVSDQQQEEGNSGTSVMTFTVTRTNTTCATAIDYMTSDGTAAVDDIDYVSINGTLTFDAGEASKDIMVIINGDTQSENDETFTVTII